MAFGIMVVIRSILSKTAKPDELSKFNRIFYDPFISVGSYMFFAPKVVFTQ